MEAFTFIDYVCTEIKEMDCIIALLDPRNDPPNWATLRQVLLAQQSVAVALREISQLNYLGPFNLDSPQYYPVQRHSR